MKAIWAILLTALIGLTTPVAGVNAPPPCGADVMASTTCCCTGCSCSASETPAADPLSAVPVSNQQMDTRSPAPIDWSTLSPAVLDPAFRISVSHSPPLIPEHVPLYQRHCSILR